MRQYLDLLQRIKDEGVIKGDRTGTGTKSIFGHQMKFDLRDGFPMLTTKKLHLRSIIHELLWFLNGDTNNRYLKENKVRIWNEWCDANQNLGKIYGYQFRKLYELNTEEYEIATKPEPYVDDYVETENDVLDPVYVPGDEFIGKIFAGFNGAEYKVISKELVPQTSDLLSEHIDYYKIQFIVTKSIRTVTSNEMINAPESIEDLYGLTVVHRGYLGGIRPETEMEFVAYDQWEYMMNACYDEKSIGYKNHGALNKTVCKRWWNFKNFLYDFPLIHGYYELMKSYDQYRISLCEHGSDTFAPDRCMFVNIAMETKLYDKSYTAVSFEKKIHLCKDLDVLDDYMFLYRPVELNNDEFIRCKIKFVDQIQNCIDLIKNDPNSRRIMVCAWNPEHLDEMNLTPCHCLFQFYVSPDETGKPKWLDLQLYQRSCDTFLGVPFNIASYSLLCMMMAQVCNLEPRYFIHTMGDTHLYLNHLDQADLQLTREPRELPKMNINKEVKDLFSFKYEDFELVDYNPHPHIQAKVSV